jgi:GNAT superfamily N-acetyltransferase
MNQYEDYKLDNPIWYALNETHKQYAVEFNGCKFYKPEYSPFGGMGKGGDTALATDQYSKLTALFYMVGDPPIVGNSARIKKQLTANQMILYKPFPFEITETIIRLETQEQKKELYELVNLVQPGFIRGKTRAMGTYFGIYADKQLVAVSGERVEMSSYTEVSAVVTHPDFRKRGFAKQLLKQTTDKIFSDKKIPEEELPKNWNHYPSPDALKSIGKSWIELGNFCTLQIPSAVNPIESNYLINVKHPLMEKIKIKEVTPFRIDHRLSKY